MTMSRVTFLRALAERYPGDWTPEAGGSPLAELAEGRYAAIVDREHDGASARDWWLADQVLVGEIPVGVIDLDTGASHGVHVAPPVVSDIGGEGAAAVPWAAPDLPAIDPGRDATSTSGRPAGTHRSP